MSAVDDQIRSLVNQSNSLNQTISSAQASYNAAHRQCEMYKRRLEEVQNVKKHLSLSFDGIVERIRARQRQTRNLFEHATSGFAHESAITSALNRDLEKGTESDPLGSKVHDCLRREIERCRAKIQSAQATMQSSQGTIDACKKSQKQLIAQARTLSKSTDATIVVR